MTTTLEIQIPNFRKLPALRFPDRCINCGKPAETKVPFRLAMGLKKSGETRLLEMSVPMCNPCAALERGIGNVTWKPFLIGGGILAALAFLPILAIAPEGVTAQTYSFPWILAGTGSLLAWIAGGTLVEFMARMLFTPVFGASLMRKPLTVLDLFKDTERMLGLAARPSKDWHILYLTFEDDRLAREFADLNPQETK